LNIGNMQAALFNITSNSVGEHLRNFELSKDDLVIADRIYSSITGIEYCLNKECQYIARMRFNCFKPYDAEGKQLNLLSFINGKECGELNAFVRKERGENAGKLIPVRICFKKKDKDALESTRKNMKRKESKKQLSFSKDAYAFNEYIVVCTSLDSNITTEEIIELYKYRWQIELYFKRLKSILGYGELPKKLEQSIFAWLNGKLMIALLIESIIGKAVFPPFDYEYEEYMEGDKDGEAAYIG